MDMSKYKSMFLTETREHLQKMGSLLVTVEADPTDRGGIDALFREAHSIKGMAASMGYEKTAELAHHLEDFLDQFRQQGEIAPEAVDRLLAGVDLLESLLEDLEEERPEREVDEFIAGDGLLSLQELEGNNGAAEEPAGGAEPLYLKLQLQETVASPAARLLVILKQLASMGELQSASPSQEEILKGGSQRQLQVSLVTSLGANELQQTLESYSEIASVKVTDQPPAAPRRKDGGSGTTVRVGTDLLDRFISLTGELITNRYMLQSAAGEQDWPELKEGLGRLARLVKDLHHQVLQVRMMPIESVAGRLPRVVRDLCRKTGKEVSLELEGAGIELDRAILEELSDPLVHMVRNAVDHGIAQRGKVLIKSWRERDQVLLQVSDDGVGIDPDQIRQRAVEKGLLNPAQAQSMRDFDALQLICLPGFSTAGEVTETSGRGVGMDVVKAAVEKLGGVLHIDSEPDQGTRITLKLPLSVAIIKVLLVECDGKLLALPITRVLQTLEIGREEVQTSGKQLVISLQEELLPLLSLRKILNLSKPPLLSPIPIVITEVLGRKVGLVVDRLVGQQEVFVQALPTPFDGLRGNSGATILGDGRIVFILDVQSLLERHR